MCFIVATIKDLRLNPPTKKAELTKQSMLKYIQEATAEEKKWFVDLMGKNKIKKKNNLTGEVFEGYDMAKVREAFAQKYFPEISEKVRRTKKAPKKTMSFEDELAALLK